MDSCEARLDRIEAQRSTEVSQEQWRQRYTPLNMIKNRLHSLSSRGLLQTRGGEDTTPPAENTESVPEFFINLKLSDFFDLPGEYVQMDAEMFSALSDGNKEWLEKLRSHKTPMACLRSDRGDSVLHLAATWGHLELAKTIIRECPCLVMEPNSKEQLPLHVAACAGHSAVVQALVETVTFVSAKLSDEESERLNPYVVKDINGDTPLHAALKWRQMESASCLVEANQRASFVANKNGVSPLYLAVEIGHVSLVRQMLKTTGPGDSEWRRTNLEESKCLGHAALKSMGTDTLDVILNEYPSVLDERDEEGRTCLSFGASMGYYDGVCNLLDRSTDGVFVCDNDGSFPIHKAVEEGHMGVVREILARCPYSKHLLNKKGQNILHVAAYSGRLATVSYLMRSEETKQLANEQDEDGNTPLHLATIKWRPQAVSCLAGPKNRLIQNNSNLTALDIAELNLKPNYIFRERMTLVALVNGHVKSDARCKHTMKLTRRSVPLDRGGNKEFVNALLLVSALIATVTFAAGFTLPGGFKSSKPNMGMANLVNDGRLIVFLIFDIVAMESSVVAVVSLIWAQLGDPAVFQSSLNVAMPALLLALNSMALAFFFGMVIAAGHVIWLIVLIYLLTALFYGVMITMFAPHTSLQQPGLHSKFSKFLLTYAGFINEDEDVSYQSSAHKSVKISGNDLEVVSEDEKINKSI